MNGCANCKTPVETPGDYLCRECVVKIVRRITEDRWLMYQARLAQEKQPS
jgi:hypothetical protein